MAGKKKYTDLKYMFMRGLIHRERWQRTRHYLKSAAECTSRAVVSLELADNPVKSVAQAKQLEAIGGETVQRLKEIKEKNEMATDRPTDGKFVSSAGALLVALYSLTEEVEKSGTGDMALISEEVLKYEAKSLSEEQFVEDDKGFCQAWWRIEVLIKRGLVKRRQHQKENVYQLQELGREIAHHLQAERDTLTEKSKPVKSTSETQLKSSQKSTPSASTVAQPENHLYTNDVGEDGIILEVDTQEMGGDQMGLGQHCGRLEKAGVRYRTCCLPCGDYRWIWRCDGTERTIPLLAERKRADDVAHSLKDGRFWRQVTKMIDWKSEFQKKDIVARLLYIIEGDPADYVVRCGDGCQGVGRCGNPPLTQVKSHGDFVEQALDRIRQLLYGNLARQSLAISVNPPPINAVLALKDLEKHPELEIRKTNCVESTVQYLAVVTGEIGKRANKGDYDMLRVNEILEENSEDSNPLEVLELEYSSPDDLSEDIKTGDKTKKHTLIKDPKPKVLETQDDSHDVDTFSKFFNDPHRNMNGSEELPPLDHLPHKICIKPGGKEKHSNQVNRRTHSGLDDYPQQSKELEGSSVQGEEEALCDVASEMDNIIDIDAELAVFSTFSGHSNLKRPCPDIKPEEPKKHFSSPLKKIKFNSSAEFVEFKKDTSQISPRHGRVYLMKRCQKSQQKRNNLVKKFDECVFSKSSSVSKDSQSSDKHLVDLSPSQGDLNSSPEPGCSVVESQFGQTVTDLTETGNVKLEDTNCKFEVELPFTSPKRAGNNVHLDPSYRSDPNHSAKPDPSVSNHSLDSAESHDDSNHLQLKNSNDVIGHRAVNVAHQSVNPQQCDSNTDSDSLPDVGFSENILKDFTSDPIPSTSGTQLRTSEARPEREDILDVKIEEEVSCLPMRKAKKHSSQEKSPLPDSEEDVMMIDSEEDYVPERKKRRIKRNSSKMCKRGQKGKPMDESLMKQVTDILPQCGQDKIRAALVKCKMNVEQAVSELLDSGFQDDDDVVDLT